MAYLGLAAGLTFVHEAIAEPSIRKLVEQLMREEAAPTIEVSPGQDLQRYIDALLNRFANPVLAHQLRQIAMDGSQKIGPRWLEPLAVNRARGRPCPATLQSLAAWILFVGGEGERVDDPMAAALAECWRHAGRHGIIDALFGPRGLLPAPEALGEGERMHLQALVDSAGAAPR
jgi:fructuronate reductase